MCGKSFLLLIEMRVKLSVVSSIKALVLAAILACGATMPTVAQSDTVTVVPSERYRAGTFHRFVFGDGYRAMWRSPLQVEVLDFPRVMGGLTPVQRGGNVQTMALRFRAADGSEYNFRSVDKELTPALPDYAQETLVDWVRQDVTSAQLPVAPIVVSPLLDAVDVLNPAPRLVILPDIPELGEFREEYGGMLGTFEHHPNEIEEGIGGFAGSVEVKGTEGMLDDVEEDPINRIDSRAFLTARLIDMLIGDWDRHEGQWRWARFDRGEERWWIPIPEDRDYAFVRYDGLFIDIARFVGFRRLVTFSADYSPVDAMMANSLDLNRRLLADLPRPAWDSVTAFVQSRITDEVIADAVSRIPPMPDGRDHADLQENLRIRRDNLPRLTDRFYRYLAAMVEVHTSDADEVARIDRYDDGRLEVEIVTSDGLPVYRRTFLPSETQEVRIDLHGGDDRATIQGQNRQITVRVIGGGGDDELIDQSRGPTALYDDRGDNRLVAPRGTRIDRRSYDPPAADENALLPVVQADWGTHAALIPWADWRSHVGVVAGVRLKRTRFGFRQEPYSSQHLLTALLAPEKGRGALEYRGFLPLEGTDLRIELRADATTMNAVRFHGFGNDAPSVGAASRVWLRELAAGSSLHLPLGEAMEIAAGVEARHTDPSFWLDSPLEISRPLGTVPIGRVHGTAALRFDTRDTQYYPRHGIHAEVTGRVAPPIWDIEESYARLETTAATYLPLPLSFSPIIALRAGGARVWGPAPFYEAAFLGGSHTLRGYQRERFAGDAMMFANAELRVPITQINMILRGDLGVSALADFGRVYVDGDSPGGWHDAQGASLWFATPILSASLTYAYGEDHRVLFEFGFPF